MSELQADRLGQLPPVLSEDGRYRALTESAPDAIVTIDADSRILSVNPAAQRIFGWPAQELLGQRLSMLMPERMRAQHDAGMANYLRTGHRKLDWRAISVPGIRKDGSEFPMEVSFGEFVEKGRHVFSGFMRDVSDRAAQQAIIQRTTDELHAALAALELRVLEAEEARRAADDANAAKAEFLRTMSHELRTPLNAIAGFVDLLELGVRGPITDAQREDLVRIRTAQGRLLALINDILNFAKLEQGLVEYDIRPIPISRILCMLGGMIEPQLRAKQIVFSCPATDETVLVLADSQKLEQVLLNLLSNAVKFTPDHGQIAVNALADGDHVHITVRDTGVGIPEDRRAAVFEPFVQVDSTLTRVHDGTGLGLSISRELVEGMRGTIALESEVGAGSTFTVTLPRAESGPAV